MGSLGDRVGRRLPLVVPCAGAVVYSICNLINAIYMDASPAFLMIGPVMGGTHDGSEAGQVVAGTHDGSEAGAIKKKNIMRDDEDGDYGRMFGIVAATEGIVSFLSTLLFNGLYPVTLDLYDGLCFHLAAALTFVCLVIVLWLHSDLDTGNVPYLRLQEAKSED
nr:hypothetical protein BaRGS_030150 [Batillaria attramentaria]